MIDHTTAREALEPVRELVAADGGDVVLVAVGDDTLHLELRLETAGCAECVMPRPFLETVALDLLRARLPTLAAVSIADPREADGGPG